MNKKIFFKLDLGSGNKPYRDYQGVDIGGGDKSVIKKDILIFLKKLPKNSVSHIYSRHYLEHAGSEQVIKILDEIDRVLIKKGEMLFILPHYSNPFFFSDPTHKTFFGVHTFSYFCETSCLKRHVPRYSVIYGWHLLKVKVNFVPMFRIRFLGLKLPFLSDILNFIVNLNYRFLELYERYFASIFSIYEVEYHITKD